MGTIRATNASAAHLCAIAAWILVVATACASFRVAAAQLAPARVEGLAALVGGSHPGPGVRIILRSDVELRAYLHLWTEGDRGATPTPALMNAALDEIIGEYLISAEAERMQVGQPRISDVAAQWERIAAGLGGTAAMQEFLKSHGATESEIQAMAERRAAVALFLGANLEGESVVTEAAIDAILLAEGETALQDVPEAQREVVRDRLSRENFQRAVERWINVLKARTTVRICTQFGAS